MDRECALCGKIIYGRRALCGACFKKWCCDENGNRIDIPKWLYELIRMQNRFSRQMCNSEIPISEFMENDLIVYDTVLIDVD